MLIYAYVELENSNIIPQDRETYKITDKTTNVSRRYNSSSSGTKSKHTVENIGSLKTGNNGKINAANLRNQKIHPFTAKRISHVAVFQFNVSLSHCNGKFV